MTKTIEPVELIPELHLKISLVFVIFIYTDRLRNKVRKCSHYSSLFPRPIVEMVPENIIALWALKIKFEITSRYAALIIL